MTVASVYELTDKTEIAGKVLNLSATTWLLTAILGQWFFAYYILVFYGGSAVQANWTAWSNRG